MSESTLPTGAAAPGAPTSASPAKPRRPALSTLGLSPGKRARLKRLLYHHGPGGGTLLILPIDQGLEHGPVDFFENPDSLDPDYQFQLALEGRFSAIALHIGLAEKYFSAYAGDVPLILKLNGKTSIPPDTQAFSSLTGTVEDAVRLGADAVGYTVYVGSPSQDRDFAQFREMRAEAERFGMPVIVWAYPRGEFVAKKGGRESLYAVDYAARVALELGADIVKLNYPVRSEKDRESRAPYNTLALSPEEAFRKVVESAGRALVLVLRRRKGRGRGTPLEGPDVDGRRGDRDHLRAEHVATAARRGPPDDERAACDIPGVRRAPPLTTGSASSSSSRARTTRRRAPGRFLVRNGRVRVLRQHPSAGRAAPPRSRTPTGRFLRGPRPSPEGRSVGSGLLLEPPSRPRRISRPGPVALRTSGPAGASRG